MPTVLAGIRQLIGGLLYVGYFSWKNLPKGKQWKTIIILSILNCLEQWFKYLGVKYISSGLCHYAAFPNLIVRLLFRGEKELS
jgi:hypothetical protein